jgi:UDP-N-acetyl-alpha-D-muramoyl-L-alanyl-L-glutamate epimerase
LVRKANNGKKFLELREKFPFLVYEGFRSEEIPGGLGITWSFNLADRYSFHPKLLMPLQAGHLSDTMLENILFHIGMVEMISYWKAACPPKIIIRDHHLDKGQSVWWKKLFFQGLGEFRYLNGIECSEEDFLHFETGARKLSPFSFQSANSVIVPIGGGKDSVVTLELVGKMTDAAPFILNRSRASEDIIRAFGMNEGKMILARRTIDSALLKLNDAGFLNGHTPFSALLAFVAVFAAMMSGRRYIALSNESSANESTVAGTTINHQYSKSVGFERDFREYMRKYITPDVEYFSFLRPLNEMSIARLFSRFPKYHSLFRSCNAGSKTDSWCGECSKCLFTFIILSPFLDHDELIRIFGKDLLEDPELIPILDELTGNSATKPFDCVGTIGEVNAALATAVGRYQEKKLPALLEHYRRSASYHPGSHDGTGSLLHAYDPENFLPSDFEKILKSALHD